MWIICINTILYQGISCCLNAIPSVFSHTLNMSPESSHSLEWNKSHQRRNKATHKQHVPTSQGDHTWGLLKDGLQSSLCHSLSFVPETKKFDELPFTLWLFSRQAYATLLFLLGRMNRYIPLAKRNSGHQRHLTERSINLRCDSLFVVVVVVCYSSNCH